MLHEKVRKRRRETGREHLSLTYGSRYAVEPVSKHELPEASMPAEVAYQICHDELNLDGNPALNLASFVTTWMEPQAERLIAETLNKNLVDLDEYPQTNAIHERCVNMLAHLYHAPEGDGPAVGTGTVGSSEAIMLAGLAAKWIWKTRRRVAGQSSDRPNIVMGANVQVVWEKFVRYFEVEPRVIPMTPQRYVLSTEEAMRAVDENTIAVVAILGSTYTGEYEPVEELDQALGALNRTHGWDVPIHVDAASGGFVAPFLEPELKWDFRLERVKSINVSGHKYGLVYPGVGWVLWRSRRELPEELIFHLNYLGGDEPTFSLNFSRGASPIVAQYYMLLRLGREGYRRIMANLRSIAIDLAERLAAMGRFTLLSGGRALPVVTFRLNDDETRFTVFDVAHRLRERGWIVPAYTLAPHAEQIAVLRVVVRENFSRDMADMLLEDLERVLYTLDRSPSPAPAPSEAPRTDKTHKTC